MAKKYRQAIVWMNPQAAWTKSNSPLGTMWFIEPGQDPAKVIETILKSNGWASLSLENRLEFIRDCSCGKVKLVDGINERTDSGNWGNNDYYGDKMHSVNHWRCDIHMCVSNKPNCWWQARTYKIIKSMPLPAECVAKAESFTSSLQQGGSIDKAWECFMRIVEIINRKDKNKSIDISISHDNSDRLDLSIDFYLSGVFDNEKFADRVEDLRHVIETAQHYTKALTGCDLKVVGTDTPVFDALMNARTITTQDMTIANREQPTMTTEQFIKYISLEKLNIQFYQDIPIVDDTVVCIDRIDNDELLMTSWLNIDECICTTTNDVERMLKHYESYDVYIWGKIKGVYEMLGKDAFLKMMKQKYEPKTKQN